MRKAGAFASLVLVAVALCAFQQPQGGVTGNSPSGPPVLTKIGTLNFATASPYTITVTGNASAGDTELLMCWNGQANSGTHYAMTVSDSVSNTWTYPQVSLNTNLQYLNTSGPAMLGIAYASQIGTGYTSGTTTLTVTMGVADGSTGGCDLYDMTNILSSPLDQISGDSAPFSTAQATSSITPSQQPEVVIGMFAVGNADTTQTIGNVIGSAATLLDNRAGGVTGNPAKVLIEYRRVTAVTAGTATCTITAAANGYANLIFTLKSN